MTQVENKLNDFIRMSKRSMVWMEELEHLCEGEQVSNEQFAEAVQMLEGTGLLTAVKSAGRQARPPFLAYRYRIHNTALKSDYWQQLHRYRFEFHPSISLDRYFALDERLFNEDLPFIASIDRYLQEHGLPDEVAAAAERSFFLVGDEKWVAEKKGKTLLERIGLWDKLLIESEYDPLMMAINPLQLPQETTAPCLHLIVENKTTFQALLPVLTSTDFHTLIYGCGSKIVGNIDMFPLQYPVVDREHRFYYFGDVDHAGIQIWNRLCIKKPMLPALAFYTACLKNDPVKGKDNQRKDDAALNAFLKHFSERDGKLLAQCLAGGKYYPQETLSTQQLQTIWRNATWR